jgi:ATP-dependent DNA ligase
MEGVVAKRASGRYTPEATTWVKIKTEPTARRFVARTSSTGAGWLNSIKSENFANLEIDVSTLYRNLA